MDLKRDAEASRYALLRRLAPAMRHQMAGALQPATLMAALIEKRLKAAAPDLPAVAKTSSDLRQFATAATRSSLDLMGWIAPDPEARVLLDKGVQEGLHLVATELSFRGFKCASQTQGMGLEVALSPMRGVFAAALLALTDAAAKPANVVVTAQPEGHDVVVTVTLMPFDTAGTAATASEIATAPDEEFQLSIAAYRKIDWSDVEAMAAADGLAFQHGPTTVRLRLPIPSR